MASLKKRMTAMLLVITLLFSTSAFAMATEEMEPTFSHDLSEMNGSEKITGSVMAAVNMDFGTDSYTAASFYNRDEISADEEIDLYAAVDKSNGSEISGYQYFPETGETLAVISPKFPEIYPIDDAPAKPVVDENLNQIEAYRVGNTTYIKDSNDKSRSVKCLYVGTYCTVWGSTGDNSAIRITTGIAQSIGQEFDSNYRTTVNSFGQGLDVDNDGKVAIFCYDIDQDYGDSVSTYTAGFFRGTDMVNSSGYIGNVAFGINNYNGMGYDCIHIDTYPGMGSSSSPLSDVDRCYSTLIHEYQHLINFSQWINAGGIGSRMETYMNEAFSMAAEHMICGTSSTASRIEYFNGSSYAPGFPLTYWSGALSNYANSYLFGQYLRTRYAQMTNTNGNAVFKEILTKWYTSAAKPASELAAAAAVLNTTTDQLVLDFWAAVYLKKSSGPYGFNGESWARSIQPYVYSSTSTGKDKIYNGGVKFYTLTSGSYTPSSSYDLEFIGFSASGNVTFATPEISEIKITRNFQTAKITFQASRAGTLWYDVSSDQNFDIDDVSKRMSIVKGANSVTVALVDYEREETNFWYYSQSDQGVKSKLSKVTLPAYSYPILVEQPDYGSITLISDGTPVNSGDYLPLGSTVAVSVTVNPGYSLLHICVDDEPISGTSFTVTGKHVVTAAFDINAAESFAGGTGTASDPYRIESAAEMKYFANRVNGGDSMAGQYIVLSNDIDMSSAAMDVIGEAYATSFGGTFSGNRHSISNLRIHSDKQYLGLFGYNTGTITEVVLERAEFESSFSGINGRVGGIAAFNSRTGTVAYCSVEGWLDTCNHTNSAIGGVVGGNFGTVTGCVEDLYTYIDDEDSTKGIIYAGGIVGNNYDSNAVVENCLSTGTKGVYYYGSADSTAYAGGIAGYNRGTVRNCVRTSRISPMSSDTYGGGIVGYVQEGTVENCYYYCPDSTSTTYCDNEGKGYGGGIAGYVKSGAIVKNSVAYGKGVSIYATSGNSSARVGQVVGYADSGTVTNCYYVSTMTASGATVNTTGKSVSAENLLSESFLSSTVGMDFTSHWEIGLHPDIPAPTPQAIRRVEGHAITLHMNDDTTVSYAYYGSTFTIPAPDAPYEIKRVTVDGAAIEGNSFTVSGDHIVVVEVGCDISITANPGEYGTVIAPSTVKAGERVTVTVADSVSGYSLGGLIVNGETVWSNSFVPKEDSSVTPIFVPEGTAGAWGDNLWWVVQDADSNGFYETLRLTGEGAMEDTMDIPWNDFDDTLTYAVIGDGITTMASGAFGALTSLRTIVLPGSLTYVSRAAFSGASALDRVYYIGTESERESLLTVDSNNDELLQANWHYITSADELIAITVESTAFGTITAPLIVAKGELVTVSVKPAQGYFFHHLVVNGEAVEGFSFTAPADGTLTVSAAYERRYLHFNVLLDTDGYSFSLYPPTEDTTSAYIAFYDANGKMVNAYHNALTANLVANLMVQKSETPGAVRCAVFFTDTNARAVASKTIVNLS